MSQFRDYISDMADVIEDARNGRMFILVDAEDRENEGDLVIPAQMCTPQAINFMAKYGRGLVCLALTQERADQLKLPMMTPHNGTRHRTAFTVSIEAREGVSTGISAHDRAHTIAVAIDPTRGPGDIITPGHVFPLIARHGGVLVRAGHTEAAVDIARLAGLYPAGVVCEVMNDDGTMARLPDLVKFAQHHGLKVGTIADLIAYRRCYDHLVKRSAEGQFESRHGGKFRMCAYTNTIDGSEHLALVKGDISGDKPVLVRMHALNVFFDVLGSARAQTDIMAEAMNVIGEAGRGVVVLLRMRSQPSLSDAVVGKPAAHGDEPLKEYGIGAQILLDLGVKNMILLTNTPERRVVALEGYGLKIVDTRSIGKASK
ncbi:MAG: 3,4-dihydroxy-2-butanone-4-phosphate synthase [Alphaproteobacteria bacterium]